MNVLFIDSVHPILFDRLVEAGHNCLHAERFSVDELKNHYPTANGIVIRSKFPVNKEFLKLCPNLKFIARSGAGMENIDIQACEERNIKLFNSPEGNANAVGEHALGLLLNLANKISKGNAEVKNGIWNREDNRGFEIDGKTIGIIGFGNNGRAFAKKLAGFDCTILAYDKYAEIPNLTNVSAATLSEIQKKADIISFHVPQSAETEHYFNDAFLRNCEKKIVLLNISRGKVVSLDTVKAGLCQNKLIGVGLDVFEFESSSFEEFNQEQLLSNYQYLFEDDRVICTPHVAGWTQESYVKLSSFLADKILLNF